jgi:Flp pilus assembly protein TadG
MRETLFTMRILRDQDGGPFVEAAVMIPILLTFVLGSVDFMNAFVQWNQATKAVESARGSPRCPIRWRRASIPSRQMP